jgi:hypothetical protein
MRVIGLVFERNKLIEFENKMEKSGLIKKRFSFLLIQFLEWLPSQNKMKVNSMVHK